MRFKHAMLFLIVTSLVVHVFGYEEFTAANQLEAFKNATGKPIGILTTSFGRPVDEWSRYSINADLLFNSYWIDLQTHFNRERIPERVVHAKGAGAFGYFQVTYDVSDVTNAKAFNNVGKKTNVLVRFSLTASERGGADTNRESRGFAVKFYTDEGNWDIVALNFDVFSIKDPIKFPSFSRIAKRNPQTNLLDPNMIWDFITLNPESLNFFLQLFGDRGIPDGYRYLEGFAIHTYQVENTNGEVSFVKIHFVPDKYAKYLRSEDAMRIAGTNPDYAVEDLFNAIGNGSFPQWTLAMQVITEKDVEKIPFDIFDITLRWPLEHFPLRPVGKVVLNGNPINFHKDVEQTAFCPGNLIPGIQGLDKIFEARSLAYVDTQNYRLGTNFNKVEVNRPRNNPKTYNRDGKPPVKGNELESPNYFPNSFNGVIPENKHIGESHRRKVYTDPKPTNFGQASKYYEGLSKGAKRRLIENIVISLGRTAQFLQERFVKLASYINRELGARVEKGLNKYSHESQ